MPRPLPTRFNCYSVRPDQLVLTQGMEVGRLASSNRGVPLVKMRRQSLGLHLSDGEHDLDERAQNVRTGWLTDHNVIAPESEESPRQILVRVPALREVQLIRGRGGARVGFHSRQHHVSGDLSSYKPSKMAGAILCFPYEDYAQPHHYPAVLVLTRGRMPFVLGLTVHERDAHGQPMVWIMDERDYVRRVTALTRTLDRQLLRFER